MNLVRFDETFQNKLNVFVKRGKSKKLALIALARKKIVILNAIVRNELRKLNSCCGEGRVVENVDCVGVAGGDSGISDGMTAGVNKIKVPIPNAATIARSVKSMSSKTKAKAMTETKMGETKEMKEIKAKETDTKTLKIKERTGGAKIKERTGGVKVREKAEEIKIKERTGGVKIKEETGVGTKPKMAV
jgi:hypothetical protein